MVLTNTAKNVNVVEALIPSQGKACLFILVLVFQVGQRSEEYQTNLEADDKTGFHRPHTYSRLRQYVTTDI